MTEYELELWSKIARFEFDQPTTKFTFANRLAKENAFTGEFADQVIDEYRKFIFLCCVSKGQIAPSHLVDQVWHLHLTYTRSYWIELCKNTIDRDLHHNPTQGGDEEDIKFKGLYKDTLALYRQYFEADPPRRIWPRQNTDPRDTLVEVDTSRNWMIPKPGLRLPSLRTTPALLAITLTTLSVGCTSYIGSAPLVLGVVVGLAAVIGFVFWLVKRGNRRSRPGGDSSDGAFFFYGSSGCGSDSSTNYDGSEGSDSGGSSDGGGDSGGSSCGGGCGGGGD